MFSSPTLVSSSALASGREEQANPTPEFAAIAHYVAFYAAAMDACYVNGEKVTPQPGSFYGGWVTSDIVGPFKGEPDSWGW